MNNFIIDASVLVETLLRTPLGIRLRDNLQGIRLLAPELLDAEVLSAPRRYEYQGRIESNRIVEALEDLLSMPILRISHRYLTPMAWQYRHNVTAYDALYVAAARSTGLPLLTTDGRLSRAPGLDVEVRHFARA